MCVYWIFALERGERLNRTWFLFSLFAFLFTQHEARGKGMLGRCCANRLRFFSRLRMCVGDPCSINFSLCYQGLGKRNGRFVCLKCCDVRRIFCLIRGWKKRIFVESRVKFKLEQVELNPLGADAGRAIIQRGSFFNPTSTCPPTLPSPGSKSHSHTHGADK